MEDITKMIGLGFVGCMAVVTGFVGWRIAQDRVLIYSVVWGALIIFAVLAGAVYHNQRRRADEARRFTVNETLALARVYRTAGPAPALPQGSDLLSALIAGAAPSEVVDADVKYSALPEGDDD